MKCGDGFHSRAVEFGDRMKRGSGRRGGWTGPWGVCERGQPHLLS